MTFPSEVSGMMGSSSNVISRKLAEGYIDEFEFLMILMDVIHFQADWQDTATEMVVNSTLRNGNHFYTGERIVADERYDILMGIPWHTGCNPHTDYLPHKVVVERTALADQSVTRLEARPVHFIGLKQFPRALRRPKSGMQFLRVAEVSRCHTTSQTGSQGPTYVF